MDSQSHTGDPNAPTRIFVSYAREDRKWLDRDYRYNLVPFLAESLKRLNVVFWFDKELRPGDEFKRYIESEIDQSQIALLIVSQSFLNSDFIEREEMPRIAQLAAQGKMIVVPVLVEPCDWSEFSILADRQMVPGPMPLIDYTDSDPKWVRVRADILEGLKTQVLRIRADQEHARQPAKPLPPKAPPVAPKPAAPEYTAPAVTAPVVEKPESPKPPHTHTPNKPQPAPTSVPFWKTPLGAAGAAVAALLVIYLLIVLVIYLNNRSNNNQANTSQPIQQQTATSTDTTTTQDQPPAQTYTAPPATTKPPKLAPLAPPLQRSSASTYTPPAQNSSNQQNPNDLNNVESQAVADYNNKDYTDAVPLFQKACDGGIDNGCIFLGVIYEDPSSGFQNYPRAASVFQNSCNNNSTYSCTYLAMMYQAGTGVPLDYIKAASFYKKACDLGYSRGCRGLGFFYRDGTGVTRDINYAKQLFTNACNLGDNTGTNNSCDALKAAPFQ